MRSVTVSLGATGNSSPVVIDQYISPTMLGIVTKQTGTNTMKLQVSYDDPFASYATDYNTNAVWVDAPSPFDALSGNETGTIQLTIRAIRINCSAWTDGSSSMTVNQAGLGGV